ncbi:MAG: porin family protein [Rufibacter sp.]
MKKLLFLFAFVTVSFLAEAQAPISLGIKAGVNYSTLTADEDEGLKYKPGFHIGAYADYAISDMVSIRPELLYTRKGSKFSMNETYTETDEFGDEETYTFKVDGDMTFQYIELPILARVKTGGFFFEGGPTFGYLLKSEADMKGSITGGIFDNYEFDGTTDGTKDSNRFEFGYAAGIGYELSNGLSFTLRYNGGITKINKDSEEETDEDEEGMPSGPSGDIRNSVFQVSVGYRFLGK